MTEHAHDTLGQSRIEQYDDGEVLYLAIDPDGAWARSEFPDDLMTIDYDEEGKIIGIEVIGVLARTAREGLVQALTTAGTLKDRDAVADALKPALAGADA